MSSASDLAIPASVDTPARLRPPGGRFARWLLEHRVAPIGPEADEAHAKP